MAKPIPYNTLPIPRPRPTLEEIGPQLEGLRRLELPGIVIPDIGPDAPTAMSILTPILAACGITIHRPEPAIMNRGGSRDQPLHIDSFPIDHPSTGMVIQLTRIGSADIVLAKLADPFCEELSQRSAHIPIDSHNDADYDLPARTDTLLDEGFIDPAVLCPEVYVGSVAAGDAIAFTFGESNPIAHRFRSTSPERFIQGHLASFTRL